MKVVLFANTDWYLFNFRLDLARRLQAAGWEVVLISSSGPYVESLRRLGFRWIELDARFMGLDPFRSLLLMFDLRSILKRERPDLIHAFTVRCTLLAGIAARSCGIPFVAAVAGRGHLFTSRSLKIRLLRPGIERVYGWALGSRSTRIIFQNESDRSSFRESRLVDGERSCVIRGSGVDCQRFSRSSEIEHVYGEPPLRCLFASRLLRDKGIYSVIDALALIRQMGEHATLTIAGEIYADNPSSLSDAEITSIASKNGIDFIGRCEDMPALMERHDVVLLPSSYGEGTPRVLIEAAAMELPIIASAIPACQGLVQPSRNGFLVPPGDVAGIVSALHFYIQHPDRIAEHGSEGRKIVLDSFSEELVNGLTMDVYGELVDGTKPVSEDSFVLNDPVA